MEYRIFSLLVIGLGVISSYSSAEESALWGPGTTVNSGVPISLPPSIEGNANSADFSNIISNTTTSAIFSGADKITESLLNTLSDSGLSSGAISTISSRVKQRMANLSIQSGTASIGNFGKDVIVGMLVDFVAEEAMNYQIQRGGNFSTVRAATTYVLIKQSYIVATSKGPVGVIVGQAGLMRDIALKDIQAFQEYTEARELAQHAELRADMWDAYGDFISSYQAARTPQEQDDASNDFQIRLENIASQRDLFDIIVPGAGALNTPGNRPGDNRNASSLSALYDDLVLNFSGLQREFLENQEYNPLAPYAVPDFDIKSILSEPIIGEITQEGTLEEFVALSGNDLQTEQTVLVAEFASPDDDTGTPDVDGGGDEGGGGEDGGQDGDRDPVGPTDPITPTVIGDLVGFVGTQDFGFGSSNRDIEFTRRATQVSAVSGALGQPSTLTISCNAGCVEIPVVASAQAGFTYLTWGQYTGAVDPFPEANNIYNLSFENVSWLVGVPVSQDDFSKRSGTAYFSGMIEGTNLNRRGTDNDYTILPSRGALDMMVNFESASVQGWGYTDCSDFEGNFQRETEFSFSINTKAVENSVGYGQGLTGFQTGRNDDSPFVVGRIDGLFFGPLANETGGSIWAGGAGGTVGVFALGEVDFTPSPTYGYTPVAPQDVANSANLEAPQFLTSAPRFRDGYDHTSWGSWTKEGMILSMDFDGNRRDDGFWVQGDLTPSQDIPRSGSASYNGDAVGRVQDTRELVTGSVSLDIDFATQNVTSEINLQRSGNDWVSGSGTGQFNTGTANQIQTSGNLNGTSGTMNLGGTFFGPDASEIGGAWGLQNVGDNNDFAVGIFRAQN